MTLAEAISEPRLHVEGGTASLEEGAGAETLAALEDSCGAVVSWPRHKTASKNMRVFFAVTPRSRTVPGTKGSILPQLRSLITKRSSRMTNLLKRKLESQI